MRYIHNALHITYHVTLCNIYIYIYWSSTKAYTDCLKHQIEIIIIEQVDVSKVSDDPKSRLDECKKREWYWQNQLKTLKQYGGLNVREERS